MYLRIFGAALLLLLLSGPALATPLVIKLSSPASPASALSLATRYLGKLIEERSGGRIRVEQLARPRTNRATHLQELQQNQVDLSLCRHQVISDSLPQLKLITLPFLFQDRQHLYQVLDSKLGEKMFAVTEKKGVKTLAFWDRGFRQLAADRALLSPLPADEVPASLSGRFNSAPEAQGTPAAAILDTDLAVLGRRPTDPRYSDLTLSDHAVSGELLLANKSFWDRLPRDLQVILSGAVKDASSYARELSIQQEEQQLKRIAAAATMRIHRLTAEQKRRWRSKLLRGAAENLGKEVQELVRLIRERAPAGSSRN